MTWPFAKYVGCGNDFILFDNRQETFPVSQPTLIKKLCHRQFGIGADGLLLLEPSKLADCKMRIFNRDGSEAEMCGNGLRCFTKWLKTLGFSEDSLHIEVMQDVLKASIIYSDVCIEMKIKSSLRAAAPLYFKNQLLNAHYLNTGVPHAVFLMDAIDQVPLEELGPFIRYHPLWTPEGANVTLVEYVKPRQIKIRTYERGVEAETLACGTGAAAAALIWASEQQLQAGPIIVNTKSNESIQINFVLDNGRFCNLTSTGPATCIFRGTIELEGGIMVSFSDCISY